MSRALGVSRQFFLPRSLSGILLTPTIPAQVQREAIHYSSRHHHGIRQVHLHSLTGFNTPSKPIRPATFVNTGNSKTSIRYFAASSGSLKNPRNPSSVKVKKAKKNPEATGKDGGKATLSRMERKLSKLSKNSPPLHERASNLLDGHRSDRPLYVTKPSVSGREMVRAIESSRLGGHRMKRHANFVPAVGPISSEVPPKTGSEIDPFDKGTDPFANQFEAAINASFRGSGNPKKAGTPEDRAIQSRLPDVQAQYLVKPAVWESANAKDIFIKNVTPQDRPDVAPLEHGLDRVLFNPGVHWLQDARSSVYNFDPYLRKICQPKDFDFDALPAYKTSSMDPQLLQIAHSNETKYIGSTSSMTSILSQFYFLISGWKPLMTKHLSGEFMNQPKGFTRLTRAPCTIQLVHKGQGVYAIDADKTYDSTTVLMQLGKSMEKMLTSTPQEFSRFTKENSWQVTAEERDVVEAFNYIAAEKFLLRSQLDCEDPRLPGKTFDLKTRAAVAIRLDVQNYELNQGYQLRKTHGFLESFEREYYDMMRSAFLKYSLQVRIGQMDGIFVAYHNTARIFGFQYIPLEEMDSRLFGTSVMGDESFRNQLRLLSKTLDQITEKYPEQDLKITVDTDDTLQSMNVWVETMPLGATTSAKNKTVETILDENGAPQMQPGANLSLWQVVCYSNINDDQVVGPFDLKPDGTDSWELRFKIGELNKPYMLNEYTRMRAQQAEIFLKDDEQIAAAAAAAAVAAASEGDEEAMKAFLNKESQANRAIAKLDSMRSMLRRVSAKGKAAEEEEELRNSDKAVVIWEPKGYVKIPEPQADSTVLAPLIEIPDTEALASSQNSPPTKPLPICYAVSNISNRMLAKMKRLNDSAQPATSEALNEATCENKSETITGTKSKKPTEGISFEGLGKTPKGLKGKTAKDIPEQASKAPQQSLSSGDSLMVRYPMVTEKTKTIKLDDLELLRRSTREFIKSKVDQDRLGQIRKEHSSLVSTITPFDDIRFKIAEIPIMKPEYKGLSLAQLERIASITGIPIVTQPSKPTESKDGISDTNTTAPFNSTEDLRERVSTLAPKTRYRLHLDFYHNYLSKYLTMRADAEPIKSLDAFMKIDDEGALERAALGLSISKKAITAPMTLLKMNRKDALKKAMLTQIYHSERVFTDDELKEMGYLPRIFDREVFKSSRSIMEVPAELIKDVPKKAKKVKGVQPEEVAQTVQGNDDKTEFVPDNHGSPVEKQNTFSTSDIDQDNNSSVSSSGSSPLAISVDTNQESDSSTDSNGSSSSTPSQS